MLKTIARKIDQPTDAVSILETDHRLVESLFAEFESADRNGKLEKAREICRELDLHARAEELVFYPRVKRMRDLRDVINEGIVEHEAVKRLVAEIGRLQPGDEFFEPKMRALKEFVKHHVREEESEVFPKLVESDLDLKALGDEILQAKQRLQQRARPAPVARPTQSRSGGKSRGAKSSKRAAPRRRTAARGNARKAKSTRGSQRTRTRA